MLDTIPDRLPLIPESILRHHRVLDPYDTRFRSCARLLQALWRNARGVPAGSYKSRTGKRRQAGHLLDAASATAGANFLSPEVARIVQRELAYREPGALIDDHRLFANLLASMPLAFNLFAALKTDAALAERWLKGVLPDWAGKIAHIQFEHSPARGDPAFTDDGTAFDVFISLRTKDGAKAFLAIEVKYSEGMTEPEPRPRARYDELSSSSDLYRDPVDPALRKNPFQQLWRQHMLAHAIVANGLYDKGAVILIAPLLNNEVQRAGLRYRSLLADNPDAVTFSMVTLEDAIAGLAAAGEADHAKSLVERYTDFSPVHALI